MKKKGGGTTACPMTRLEKVSVAYTVIGEKGEKRGLVGEASAITIKSERRC